jgi:CelD/BcsL family acetyltransferase involved in cellulose biosynthesis
LRRALKKTGEIEVTQAASLDQADDILNELIELHQARWRAVSQPGAFASQRFTAFQRELVTRLLPEERVVLLRVRSQSLTIGCLMLLVDRGRLLDYLSGFAPFEATPSPGIISHYLAMEQALAQGYRAYDFLVGDKRHKANLATDSRNLIWATWRRPSWKNRAIAGLRSLKRKLSRHPANVELSPVAKEEQ